MIWGRSLRLALTFVAVALLFGITTTAGYADSIYTVQPGDTLSGIAIRFSSNVQAIVAANSIIDPNLIYVGQRLTIPSDATSTGSEPSLFASEPRQTAPQRKQTAPPAGPGAILGKRRLLTYYGNPFSAQMGILGELGKEELVEALKKRAAQYEALSDRPVQPAIHFIATVAQAAPGADGMYRARMPIDVVQEYAELARRNGMLFFLDIQVGRSTVEKELAPWIGLLQQEHVHLALDPEFDMWGSQVPGQQLGHMTAAEINYAQRLLTDVIEQNNLVNNKILIVHQFAASMLPDKDRIESYPRVELVTDMDGFGSQALKRKHYEWYVRDELIEYAGIKLFFRQDSPLFQPSDVMSLDPVPDVIIYQ